MAFLTPSPFNHPKSSLAYQGLTAFLTPSPFNLPKSSLAYQGLTASHWGLTPSQVLFQPILRLCRFLHFYAPKTSKMLPFPDFFSKVPKMTKGTI